MLTKWMYFMSLKIAIVYNFILLVILIRYFYSVIPQPIVDTFIIIIIITREISCEPTREIGRNISFYLFTYCSFVEVSGTSRNTKLLSLSSGH